MIVAEEAELVREIIAGVAEGSTLYGVAKRLNDRGLPSPGRRYPGGERKPGRSWSATTIHNIVHQRASSGVHEVRIKDTGETIERPVPAIVSKALQKRAQAVLRENRRYRDRETDRRYLLAGLVRCAVCGYACIGHPATARGTKYHYYRATCGRTGEGVREGVATAPPHRAPFLNASWLEELVWSDVRRFLEDPGETLERVRAQLAQSGDTEDLARRQRDLQGRLAARQAEKDRYIRTFAQGHISEEELETYLADLKGQIENLRLLIGSVEADLSSRREQAEIAETAHAWLLTLRERLSEVERDTEEAFQARRRLVRLLVAEVVAGEKRRDGTSEIRITYRFDPPDEPETDGDGRGLVVATVPNGTSLS